MGLLVRSDCLVAWHRPAPDVWYVGQKREFLVKSLANRKKSADHNREPVTGRFVRYAGFVCLCGVGMGVLAAVVLLPSYGKLLELRHRNKCDALRVREAAETIAALDRFRDGVGSDELLTRRFALTTMGLKSDADVVVSQRPAGGGESANMKKFTPVSIAAIRYPTPPAPDPRILYLAAKLRRPPVRYGMLLLAGLMIISAISLFRPLLSVKG